MNRPIATARLVAIAALALWALTAGGCGDTAPAEISHAPQGEPSITIRVLPQDPSVTDDVTVEAEVAVAPGAAVSFGPIEADSLGWTLLDHTIDAPTRATPQTTSHRATWTLRPGLSGSYELPIVTAQIQATGQTTRTLQAAPGEITIRSLLPEGVDPTEAVRLESFGGLRRTTVAASDATEPPVGWSIVAGLALIPVSIGTLVWWLRRRQPTNDGLDITERVDRFAERDASDSEWTHEAIELLWLTRVGHRPPPTGGSTAIDLARAVGSPEDPASVLALRIESARFSSVADDELAPMHREAVECLRTPGGSG